MDSPPEMQVSSWQRVASRSGSSSCWQTQWPAAKSHREQCKAELRALKEYDSAVAGPCSWEYLAGFFDAEGSIAAACVEQLH